MGLRRSPGYGSSAAQKVPPLQQIELFQTHLSRITVCSVRFPNTAVGFADALTLIRFTCWETAGPAPCSPSS